MGGLLSTSHEEADRENIVTSYHQRNSRKMVPSANIRDLDRENTVSFHYQHDARKKISSANNRESDRENTVSFHYQHNTIKMVSSTNERDSTFNDRGNAISSYHQYSARKMASSANDGDSTSFTTRVKKHNEKFKQIISNIVSQWGNGYNVVQGNWVCQEENQSCENEWQENFTLDLLRKYQHLDDKYQIFRKVCGKCNKKKNISSFRLYMTPLSIYLKEVPTTEIIYHLVWIRYFKPYYRVLGLWKCMNCQKTWGSAYTWISLQMFIAQTPGIQLGQGDFLMQKCKKCKEDDNTNSVIRKYEPLVKSESGGPHKRELCAKCQHGDYCTETGTYFGYWQNK